MPVTDILHFGMHAISDYDSHFALNSFACGIGDLKGRSCSGSEADCSEDGYFANVIWLAECNRISACPL